MQIFGQVWLWSLGSFLLGVLFTWLLLVNPARRRLTELEEAASRQSREPATQRQPTKVAEPVGKETDRFLDDLFESPNAPKAQPPILPPPMPSPAAATQAFAPVPPPSAAGLTAPPELPAERPQNFASRLDPTAPPEPPIPDESETELSDNSFRQFTESTTVFVPPAGLRIPEKQEPTGAGDDWFAKEEAPDPDLITDVEDDERVDDQGTIFTQHTTPIPDEMIRSLDNETQVTPGSAHAYDPQAAAAESDQRHGDQYEYSDQAAAAGVDQHYGDQALASGADQFGGQSSGVEPDEYSDQAVAADSGQHYGEQSPGTEPAQYEYSHQAAAAESGQRHGEVSASEADQYEPQAPGHDYSHQVAGSDQHYDDQVPASGADQFGEQSEFAQHQPPAHEYNPEPVQHYDAQAPAPEPVHHYDPQLPEPQLPPVERTQRFEPIPSAHEETGRSLFEPVVPVAEADSTPATPAQSEFIPPGPFGPGSAMPLPGGGAPAPEFGVKASVTALRYCTQDNPQFDRIVAEVWFRTPSDAERVGFRVLS